MGHANLKNISQTVNHLLHARPSVTIKEMVDELVARKQGVHASEGLLTEPYMLSMACEQILEHFYKHDLVEPVGLNTKQRKILKQWGDDGMMNWDCGNDGNGGEYAILDSIRWTALKKRLPVMGYIST